MSAKDAAEVVALLGEMAFIKTHDLSLLAPNLVEVDLGAAMAENAVTVRAFVDHLKTLDPAQADALARRTTDELVGVLRELLDTTPRPDGDPRRQ